jgi:non-canonical (house-cleaning) NTP pyrophosphatase
MIKITVLLCITLLFVSCGSSSKTKTPKWYLKTNNSNSVYFFGLGEGNSKNEAKINALNQISSEISIGISSNIEITKTSQNNNYSKKIEQVTKASVAKIEFSGVEIVKNVESGNRIYTKLKVNRSILFDTQKIKVDKVYNQIVSLYRHSENNGILELLKNGEVIKNNILKESSKLALLKAIDNNFNQNEYEAKLNKITNNVLTMKSEAGVYISGEDNAFKEMIKQYVSSLGLTIISSKNAVSKDKLLIINVKVSSKLKKVKSNNPRLKGASFAEVYITINTLNSSGKILANNTINVLNISKEGYKEASIKTQKFERKIKQNGILNILLKKIR